MYGRPMAGDPPRRTVAGPTKHRVEAKRGSTDCRNNEDAHSVSGKLGRQAKAIADRGSILRHPTRFTSRLLPRETGEGTLRAGGLLRYPPKGSNPKRSVGGLVRKGL